MLRVQNWWSIFINTEHLQECTGHHLPAHSHREGHSGCFQLVQPYPLNAFMHSCRKTEGSDNCCVMWSCQIGLGRILPQYELGQVTELTSSNLSFPSNGHNTSITQLWRGFNRRPSVKRLARSLMLNNYVPSFFLYITRSWLTPECLSQGLGQSAETPSEHGVPTSHTLHTDR